MTHFLQDVRGFTYSQVGILFSILAIGTTTINLVAGRLSARWGVAMVLSAIWLAFLTVWQIPLLAGAGIAFFTLGGVYSLRTVAAAGLSHVVQPQDRGMAFSVLELMFALAMASAARAAGELYSLTPSHDLPLIGALMTLPILLGIWLVCLAPGHPGISGETMPGGEQASLSAGN